MRKILIALTLAAMFSLAPAARAGLDGHEATHCDQVVRRIGIKANLLRPATRADRRLEVYLVRGTFPDGILHYGADFSWDWVYAETNHEPGLQRDDSDCHSGAAVADTVIASSELWCTCGYPLGYPPESWVTGQDPIPSP